MKHLMGIEKTVQHYIRPYFICYLKSHKTIRLYAIFSCSFHGPENDNVICDIVGVF